MKSKYPLISVIIPTYNRENLISRAIESVLNQTFQNFELIVVDDGSTDNTEGVVGFFNDERIVYIKQKNGGPSSARNTGINKSKGEYISFLDSDDEWVPEKLERQLDVFKNSKVENLGFVGGRVRDINKNGEIKIESKGYYRGDILEGVLKWKLIHGFINSSTVIIKREVMERVDAFDIDLSLNEDVDYWLRISKKYNFDMVDEVITICYANEGSVTNISSYEKRAKNKKYFLEKNKEVYEKYPKIYSKQLRNVGTYCMLTNETKEARKFFLRSIKTSPLSIRNYFNLVLSLLGQTVYLFVLNKKVKKFDS